MNLLAEGSVDIEPVFLDFEGDITVSNVSDVELIYKKNDDNQRFSIKYLFEMGTDHDKKLGLAVDYLKFIGTNNMNPSGTNMTIASQAFGTVHTVSSESAMISATTTGGDIVIRTDVSKTFIHNGGSAGSAADFSELQFSGINNIALTAGAGITLSRTSITNTDNDLTITNTLASDSAQGLSLIHI